VSLCKIWLLLWAFPLVARQIVVGKDNHHRIKT